MTNCHFESLDVKFCLNNKFHSFKKIRRRYINVEHTSGDYYQLPKGSTYCFAVFWPMQSQASYYDNIAYCLSAIRKSKIRNGDIESRLKLRARSPKLWGHGVANAPQDEEN